MPRIPIEPGLLSVPEGDAAPQLLASRCEACGEVFHPPRPVCLKCHGRELAEITLDGQGTVYALTRVHGKLRPSLRTAKEYWVAQIDLAAGPRAQGVLAPDIEEPRIGMHVKIALETLRVDEQGNETVVHHFCRDGGKP